MRRASNVISSVARASGVEISVGRHSEVGRCSDVGVAGGRCSPVAGLPEVLPPGGVGETVAEVGEDAKDAPHPAAELVSLVVDRRCSSAAASAPPPPPHDLGVETDNSAREEWEGSLDTRDGSCSRRV